MQVGCPKLLYVSWSKLQWKEHVKQATSKGNAAFEALSGITAATWDPLMRRSRIIYTAVVRPTMLYGAQIWGMRGDGKPMPANTISPLKKIQNKYLRCITGGYKRSST